jgi:hypothetical protein
MWSCSNCRAEVEDELEICWQCGTGRDGSPPPKDWRSELAGPKDGSERRIQCIWCQSELAFSGRKRSQDGSYAREVLLGEFFLNQEELDMYVCRGCGKVEFFAPQPAP